MTELVRHVVDVGNDGEIADGCRVSVRTISSVPAPPDGATALYEVVQFSRSFAAVVGEFSMPVEHGTVAAPPGWMQWHFRVCGEALLERDQGEPVRVGESSAVLRICGDEVGCDWRYCGEHQRFLTLLVHPRFMVEILESSVSSSALSLLDLMAGDAERFVRMQINASLGRAIGDVLRSPYAGRLRLVHQEAKALEVLCLGVEGLRQRIEKQQPSVMLSQRDIARLGEVRVALIEHPTRWLTIHQLSRQFALNQRKLKEGFKHLFGETVFQFAQDQRMIRARRMLEEDRMSIGHVSSEIGYDSHASFTAAFKRHFGYLPREARLRGRARHNDSCASVARVEAG